MRKMKDSGVEWIGAILNDKCILRNKYLLTYNKGKIACETNMKGVGIPYIGASNLDNIYGDSHYELFTTDINVPEVEKEDVLILWDGARAGLIGTNHFGAISSTIVKIVPLCEIYRHFLYWYLKGYEQYLYDCVNGTTIPHMSRSYIESLFWINWTFDEQQHIAKFLDRKCAQFDAIITKQQAVIERLKLYKQSVITEAVTKGLDPNVPMKDSGVEWIGKIPAHWKIGQLKFFISIRSGVTLGKKYPIDTKLYEYPYLRVANVQVDHTDLLDVATIQVSLEDADKYRLYAKELLMTEGGDRDKLGRGCVWNGEIPHCLHQNHIFAVSTNAKKLDVYYLDYVTTSDVARNYFDCTAKKTTNLASTNSTTILQFRLPIPPVNEQKEIMNNLNEKCGKINIILIQKQALIDKLTQYKKSLIYEAVTGKLEV